MTPRGGRLLPFRRRSSSNIALAGCYNDAWLVRSGDCIGRTDDELKRELLDMDVHLRGKQVFWETPRAILLIVATTAAVAGVLGYKIGQAPQPIVIQVVPATAR